MSEAAKPITLLENIGLTIDSKPVPPFIAVLVPQVHKLALLGKTMEEIGEILEIKATTWEHWIIRHDILLAAHKIGRAVSDGNVAASLHQRALGYLVWREVPVKLKNPDKTEYVEIHRVREQLPPDTGAAIFWLKNRQKEHWRDVQEHKMLHEISRLSPEERQAEIDRLNARLSGSAGQFQEMQQLTQQAPETLDAEWTDAPKAPKRSKTAQKVTKSRKRKPQAVDSIDDDKVT